MIVYAIGFVIGNGLKEFFGAVSALLLGMGMIGWGLFFLFGKLWKSTADAAYAFGVAGAEIASSTRKGPFIIGDVAIGTVLALTGAEGHIVGYLGLLGVLNPGTPRRGRG
ncbi:hypothetical protein [Brachybacterium tyrofermentans]|uniref:hypothetical protein n=1 Tax=Brachybacterium tyrofermentans TaxID=47848 RepID=UPI003FD5BAA4